MEHCFFQDLIVQRTKNDYWSNITGKHVIESWILGEFAHEKPKNIHCSKKILIFYNCLNYYFRALPGSFKALQDLVKSCQDFVKE